MAEYPESLFPQITDMKKRAFLAAFAHTGRIRAASHSAQMNWRSHYNWLKNDPDYAAAFEEARTMAGDSLEDEAIRRAVEGVTKTIFYKDEAIAEERVYADTLLIFLLKGAKPEKYKERVTLEHRGTIELAQRLQELPTKTDSELEQLVEDLERYATRHD